MSTTPPPALAQRGSPLIEQGGQSVDQMIADFMQEHGVAGMALAIVQAPYVTQVRGYGLSDPERKLLVASNTLFGLGTMQDAYTAVAVMQLVEEGKLSLDDPLSRHLDFLPPAWGEVTVGHLLQHQSGLPPLEGPAEGPPSRWLQPVAARSLAFPPGRRAARSTTDYALLRVLVERASGMSYASFVRRRQFEPLGLRHTCFASELESLPWERLGPGERHRGFLGDARLINPSEPATGSPGPSDPEALYSSAEDVSIWDVALAGGLLIRSPELRRVLYTPATLKDGRALATSGPWEFPGRPGLMVATGSGGGFSCLLSRFTDPSDLVCVTLLANKEGLDLTQLARRIAGAFDPRLGPPPGTAGMRVQQSPYPVGETLDRLEKSLKEAGIQVMARLDHAAAATAAGLSLPPTGELIFGNPAAGTLLMQSSPAVAVDLPLRALAWQEEGAVWLAATDPVEICRRHGLQERQGLALKMRQGVDRALLEAVSAY
ncbi:MAG TPA: serine hydrolase [Candidatus Nitrosotenuis sp.]|nr:serine hydrolase [Candidatus Nitrosotenuis sp.]